MTLEAHSRWVSAMPDAAAAPSAAEIPGDDLERHLDERKLLRLFAASAEDERISPP